MIFYTGGISNAEIIYDLLMKLDYILEDEVTASLIGLYGKQQKLKEAQDVFKAAAVSSKPGKLALRSIIDAYAKCGKPEELYQLYKEASAQGHGLDAVTISILVNTLTNYGMAVNIFSGAAKP